MQEGRLRDGCDQLAGGSEPDGHESPAILPCIALRKCTKHACMDRRLSCSPVSAPTCEYVMKLQRSRMISAIRMAAAPSTHQPAGQTCAGASATARAMLSYSN